MALLSKKQFLDNDDKQYKIVKLPELGGEVKIRSMSGKDSIEFEQIRKSKSESEWVFWAIVQYCINEDGSPMFEEGDLEAIKNKSSSSIRKIFDAICDLNIISDAKIEEEAKN